MLVVLALLGALVVTQPALAAGDPCVSGNAVACENSKPGNPASEWDLAVGDGAGADTIQGFATQMSVTPGSTVQFKVKAAQGYTIKVYRLGYYNGLGARLQGAAVTVATPAVQPGCISDPSTQNYDCGNWSVSASWAVPAAAVSGVYVAHLVQTNGDDSHITFVVRDDASRSDVVFKTSDATWQAYNSYGGANFYTAPTSLTGTQARAFKISYNRPFATRGLVSGRDFLFSNEYPTLRFLERNGVDVSYTTDVDVSAGTTVLTNHHAFMSVGHDEYWTLPERNAVTAARDAGVNLMFLSGNEVYWHTRLEPSIDGSATPNRTIVCYKDSWESKPIDPSAEGTATWRDPRFKTAPNATNPENNLTGTMYMSNNTDLTITVSQAEGRARFWRNTSVASLAAGGTATLAPHTVGYESDEDVDNGSRPAGLMRLSTTTGPSPQKVQDAAGVTVAAGTTTHSLTLYRAASGALVFGAGTIQWGWGLDQYHDGDNSNAADPRMQQATLNMLADMGALPTTLMSGLVQPTASTDTTAPVVTVTSPTTGATLANGSQVTVTGTASDAGGVVTTVEVSLDGGASYHRATGTTSWSWTGVLSGAGTSSIKVRAADDSANLSTPVSTSITVNCPCSLFGQSVPGTPSVADTSGVELGVKLVPQTDGFVSAIRFYKGSANTGTHTGTLWSSTGSPLASGTFTNETASGWQTLTFSPAVAVTGGQTYVASYFAPNGRYAADSNFFAGTTWTAPPLTAPGRPAGVANGVYNGGHGFPSSSYGDTNYWVDVLFSRDDTTPPTVTTRSPLPGSTSVATTAKPSATFAGTVTPSSVTMTLRDAQGTAVPGATAFSATSRTVTFTPSSPLARSATYTASVQASSAAGVPMPTPDTWSFTVAATDPQPGICPCSVWPDTATPATASANDTGSVELGLRFTADADGSVNGVRFYKGPLNLGTHTGSLWTSAGALLATVTFTGESSSGWQTAYFSAPVAITGGTTYIVSYRAPSGGYAVTSSGLSVGVDNMPLHALANGATYTYGSGAPLTGSSANYWVDVVYTPTDAAPTVASVSPGATATNVPIASPVSATLAGLVQAGSAQLSVTGPDGSAVPGATTWNASTRTVTFTPSASLAAGATYTATASGATALSGYAMTPYTWSFTTAGSAACPCTLFASSAVPGTVDAGDASAIEVGTSFLSSVDGKVTGVRFYKSAANTGTHTGTLWSASGSVLATGTFTGESATGWQTLTFAQPVAVTAGTTYVVSYYAPNGHYSATPQFFSTAWTNGPLTAAAGNGRYRYGAGGVVPVDSYGSTNYWVDPIFSTGPVPDTTPPSVVSTSPFAGSTSQPVTGVVVAGFSEDLAPATVTMTLKDATGATVPGAVGYDAATDRVTYTTTAPLGRGATYTASARASDVTGNAMTAATTWSFTTAQPDPTPGACPCSVWTDATTPAVITQNDPKAVELGTAFTTDAAGSVTGVRFYKGPQNVGTHTVSLWTTDGTRVATATVASESSAGWQTGSFASPVAVTAGTTYVVSYLAPTGYYSTTVDALTRSVDAPPLHTVANGGRYLYGGGYPATVSSAAYWVDPVLVTGPAVDTTPPTVTAVTATPSATGATVTWTTNEPASTTVSYGTTPSLGSTATASDGTSHSVALSGLTGGSTYYYRVTSADVSGNTTTSPATSSAPASFQTVDVTAPVVSAVAVAVSGTTATVTWTTDEASTSTVSYGTGATLGSTAGGAAGTAHSVTLSGLTEGTTYSYRVGSVDAAGNVASSPPAPAAPATFTVPDRTPPVVSAVAASGSGTSATVTWSTNESSTSVVTYGTSATALSATATGAVGTSHSVPLTGLAPNTRYYYRVTSADASGNTTTAPDATVAAATYVPSVAPVVQTTVADFAGGTLTGSYVSQNGDGEVGQAPSTAVEFDGTTLPSTFTSSALAPGSSTTLAGGRATLSGTQVASVGTAGAPKSMEVAVTSRLTSSMRVGFGTTTGNVFAGFGVSSSGQLVAIANDGVFFASTTALTTVNPAVPHRYRVDWTSSTNVSFVVDGATVLSNVAFWPGRTLNAVLRDATVDTTPLVVDWLRASPFDPSSTYVSKVVDAGAAVGWDTLSFSGSVPAGTTCTIQVRSGSTSTPGAGWTAWATVPSSGAAITRTARYLQYQVLMTSSGNRFATSTTDSVTLAFHVL
ncbi:hypothetical protein GCM10009814_10890 [Lapillicoccus jejuensis]|uniref:Purple acid phosphatase-like protein n=1 Tax=Lapillicoccus jejuensis TaxID=402171 RepID=A0A542E1D9_9MICO|nr:purple acid phosphatase-like protein [Lapillicoccus jejuensis]